MGVRYTWSMNKSTHLRKGRTCVFLMHVHLVFVTKYRRNVFTKEILSDWVDIFTNVCKDFESRLIECDGEEAHVYLLINTPPKISISKLVNSLKGVSFRLLRKKGYPTIQNSLWGNPLWSPVILPQVVGVLL